MKQLLLSLLFITAISCKVAFVPSADEEIKKQVERASIQTEALYLAIAAAENKTYTAYAINYAEINAEINSLVLKNTYRLHSESFQGMIANVQLYFTTYEDEHKAKGSITTEQANIYKRSMAGWWAPLLESEKILK